MVSVTNAIAWRVRARLRQASPMPMNRPKPVWMDAFMALPCMVVDDTGTREVRLEPVHDALRYVATETPQILQPFCLNLAKGDVVTIRWKANDTSPTIRVKAAAWPVLRKAACYGTGSIPFP